MTPKDNLIEVRKRERVINIVGYAILTLAVAYVVAHIIIALI